MSGGSLGTPNLTGDFLAVVMTFFMAAMMVLIRKYPKTPSVLAAGSVSSLQVMIVGGLIGEPLAVVPHEIGLLVAFGSVQALGIILLTEGAKLIPASLSALIGTLEIPLAVLGALIILAEVPGSATLGGGAIVLLAIILQIRSDWLKTRREPMGVTAAAPD
jgi:drug/metabolite transporter (DMT)-like permease